MSQEKNVDNPTKVETIHVNPTKPFVSEETLKQAKKNGPMKQKSESLCRHHGANTIYDINKETQSTI